MRIHVDELANIIRRVDGNHKLGAGALAEAIVSAFSSAHVVDAEPVAWLYSHPAMGRNVQMDRWEPYGAWTVTPLYTHPAQQTATVPEEKYPTDGNGDEDTWNRGWNACREAMLIAAPSPPAAVSTAAPSNDAERRCVPKLELPRTFTRDDLAKEQRRQEIELEEWLDATKTSAPSNTATVQIDEKRLERLEDAMHQIETWGRAYPLSVFPEPDWAKAHQVLKDAGMTIDAISASNMRHVITKVVEIAQTALGGR